jgi:membrane-anchored protein YejM (alkaline phosphatase superfamily)
VLDTVRADAVSAYGAVEGTTPAFDALANRGTLFARAYAPSPWTVSSHASLFSGLRVDEHGVGLDGAYYSEDSMRMLAEDLREAGYETVGFAENPLVSEDFGLAQGFGQFASPRVDDILRTQQAGDLDARFFELSRKVRDWARARDRSRPYFLFVNIMDAHDPYSVRDVNAWVPDGTSTRDLEFVARYRAMFSAICRKAPSPRDRAILRGLYLGDVASADAKLARILDALAETGEDAGRITVLTSDHGEHLGEHKLLGHLFSVRTPALHIPLVVSGVDDLAPGVVEGAVELRSIRQSLLCWALGKGCPAKLATATLEPPSDGEPIFSIWSERSFDLGNTVLEKLGMPAGFDRVTEPLKLCEPSDRVFGELVSMIRYPMKINWYSDAAPTLHDLSWDPWERSDLRAKSRKSGRDLPRNSNPSLQRAFAIATRLPSAN